MIEQYFYHSTLKNAIKLFGKLFSALTIKHGTDVIKVPITYAKKDKIIQKYNQWLSGDSPHESTVILPRLAFVMGDPQIDKNRQLNRLNKIYPVQSKSHQKYSFNAIPYSVPFVLSIMAKNFDDILQVVEQIVPFFSPEFTVTIQDVPELELETDYIFKLDTITEELDTFDGTFDDRRIIVQSISFTCDLNLYYPVMDAKQIKKILLDGVSSYDPTTDPLFMYSLEVVPFEATPSDVHILKESWQDNDNAPVVHFTSEDYEIFITNLKHVVSSDYTDQQKFDEIWALIQDQLDIIIDSLQITGQIPSFVRNTIDAKIYSSISASEIIGYIPIQPLELSCQIAPYRFNISCQIAS